MGPAHPRRVGVIGLGTISQYYLRAIEELPDWDLRAVCDVRATALAPHRLVTRCFQDHRDMLDSTDLDAVIVTVPNDVHAAVCRDSLRRGVPVCVEKPLAVSLEEGRELVQLAHACGVSLFTAFHRRYNDNVLRLLRRVHGRIIESVTVRYFELIEEHIGADTWYLDPRRCGGGCVADNGPNAFDLVRLVLGEAGVVRATVERDRRGTDRRAVIELTSTGGVPATVELDWSHPGEVKDIEVRLDDGSRIRADMLTGYPGFKSSLWHEYVGILDDFATTLAVGARAGDDGLSVLEAVAETYRTERSGAPVPGGESA